MVSILKTDVVETAAGGPVQLAGQKGAKTLCRFYSAGIVAIESSFNVSSLTDSGVGNMAVNFTNNFADRFYQSASQCTINDGPPSGGVGGVASWRTTTPASNGMHRTGSHHTYVTYSSFNTAVDTSEQSLICFGDLA